MLDVSEVHWMNTWDDDTYILHKIQNQCIGCFFKANYLNYERLTSFTHAQIFNNFYFQLNQNIMK